MKPITIRQALPDDLDTLLDFEQGVIYAERPFDNTLKKEKTTYYDLDDLIHSIHAEIVVAQLHDHIIGCGYAKIVESKPYLQHTHHAHLGFMYVQPEHRGKGINKMIIASLTQWAASKNVTEIRLEVYPENEAAIKAYEKAGFSKHMIEMRMKLS